MEMSSKSPVPNAPPSETTEHPLDWSELTIRLAERPLEDFHQWLEDDLDLLERELQKFASQQSQHHERR